MSMSNFNEYTTSFEFDFASCCKYPGCEEIRVRKITGELHNFCMYHRQKASENQRRYAQNKRERKRQKKLAKISSMKYYYQDKYLYMSPRTRALPSPPSSPSSPSSVFQLDNSVLAKELVPQGFVDGFYDPLYPEEYLQQDAMWLSECLFPNENMQFGRVEMP